MKIEGTLWIEIIRYIFRVIIICLICQTRFYKKAVEFVSEIFYHIGLFFINIVDWLKGEQYNG